MSVISECQKCYEAGRAALRKDDYDAAVEFLGQALQLRCDTSFRYGMVMSIANELSLFVLVNWSQFLPHRLINLPSVCACGITKIGSIVYSPLSLRSVEKIVDYLHTYLHTFILYLPSKFEI